MAKVYVVTAGTYSDYHIEAAFSVEEKAKEYVETRNDPETGRADDNYKIEEFEMDAPFKPLGWCWNYCVGLNLETGDVKYKHPPERVLKDEHLTRGRWVIRKVYEEVMADSTVSEEHALKLAAEGRQAWLRNKEIGHGYGVEE